MIVAPIDMICRCGRGSVAVALVVDVAVSYVLVSARVNRWLAVCEADLHQ